MPPKIFNPDEFRLSRVLPGWSNEQLLSKEEIFYLADVARKLRLSSVKVREIAQKLHNQGKSPWDEIGVQCVWSHWIVRMKVFRHFLKEKMPHVRETVKEWDGNQLLAQEGIFFLVDVCEFIPFTPNQIRYQAHRLANSRKEIGVWKDEFLNAFLVEMPVFAQWIRKLWLDGFHD